MENLTENLKLQIQTAQSGKIDSVMMKNIIS